MTFVIPQEQRALTPEEYAQLGYIQRGDLSGIDMKHTPDKPLSSGFTFPAYRAETKEEALVDIGIGIAKVGYAVGTGGVGPTIQTTLGYTWSLLT